MTRNAGRGESKLTDRERLDWLRLIRSSNVGPITFRELLGHCGSAGAALEALPDLARRGGRAIRIASQTDAEREIAALAAIGARIVARGEAEYPAWLAEIDSAPPLIALRGEVTIAARPMVAIVGSRNASLLGIKFTKKIARGLGERGYVVVSGLARGIDTAAHEASIQSGTVAVLAGGLDRIYPPDNLDLAAMIIARGGAHLSEMPLGWEPRARDFPRRNRIVSGLSMAVVVVEAAARSGSLITARLAAEQGRIVFAVPGSPLDPRAEGTNRLLRDGARILTEVDDIVSEIEPMIGREPDRAFREDDEPKALEAAREPDGADRRSILEALGPAPVEIDELIRHTGLRPPLVQLILLELDLAGRIARHPRGRVSIIDHAG